MNPFTVTSGQRQFFSSSLTAQILIYWVVKNVLLAHCQNIKCVVILKHFIEI